jgi:phosphoglycolate phosphatase-like HAD superfamily hydrolase
MNARAVSKRCGFDRYIKVCIGNGDNRYEKPQLEFTESIVQAMGGEYNNIVLIGDSPTDVKTAINYKAKCYAVATGSHTKDELIEAGANKAFNNLNEIIQLWEL